MWKNEGLREERKKGRKSDGKEWMLEKKKESGRQ